MTRGRGKDAVSVLVVGGRPVGLVLAGDLGWRGIDCLLVEQSEYPRDDFQDNVYLTSLGGYEMGREPFPTLVDERPPPTSPQKRDPPNVEPLVAAARQRRVPLEVIAIDEPAVTAAYESRRVLVRPDGHTAWRGDDFADPQALFDTVCGFASRRRLDPGGAVRQAARLQ